MDGTPTVISPSFSLKKPGGSTWDWLLPLLGATLPPIVGGILQARATGKAAEVGAEAGERAAELQAQTARESLELARQIYNQDVGLNWPGYVVSTGALKKLARGTGIATPPELFAVPGKPPTLSAFTPPSAAPTEPEGASTGDLSQALLSAQATAPSGSNLPRTATGIATGAGLGAVGATLAGAKIGIFAGPVGTAIGAGIGAGVGGVASQFGKGRREANQIAPYQNALTAEFGSAMERIKAKELAGALTQQDWQAEIDRLTPLYTQFQGLTQRYGRAGPGARTTIDYMGNMLNEWKEYAAAAPTGRRQGGFTRPGMYLVGENGPEILEMAPDSEGYVYPNSAVKDMLPRKSGGPVQEGTFMVGPAPKGLLKPGNIDLASQLSVKNPDGTFSTVRSISFALDDGSEVLLPTITPEGEQLSDSKAFARFEKTGKHLGIFSSPENATAYAKQLHETYASQGRKSGGPVTGRNKIHKVMSEFSRGTLRSSSGHKVTSRRQAIAIAMSEAGMARRQAGGAVFGGHPGFDEYGKFTGVLGKPYSELTPSERAVVDQMSFAAFSAAGRPGEIGGVRPLSTGAYAPFTPSQSLIDRTIGLVQPQQPIPAVTTALSARAAPATLDTAGPIPAITTAVGGRLPQYGTGAPITDFKPFTAPSATPPPPPATTPNPQDLIKQWGWVKDQYGIWRNAQSGDTGYWAAGGQFINSTQGKIFDPTTGKLQDFSPTGAVTPTAPLSTEPGFNVPENPYANLGKDIPTANMPTDQPFGDWQFDNEQGVWYNAKSGLVYNPKTDMLSDPNDPERGEWSRWETGAGGGRQAAGEFLQPWQGQFSFDPAKAGYQPFNRPFGFDPEAAGFQAFNRPFEFETEDLYKDPGYQFRQAEGQKAIERSAAAQGMLQSGPTMKALERWSQGLASQEFAAAYNRSRSEYDLRRGMTTEAYNRGLGEFALGYGITSDAYSRAREEYTQTRNEFIENQLRKRQWLAAMAGLSGSAEGGA